MFATTHQLEFLVANKPFRKQWVRFRVGTCHGLYRPKPEAYEILAIINEKPGNGHLDDVFQWFEESCRRDRKALKVMEIWNAGFKRHLIEKRGFTESGKDDVIKTFKA